MVWLARISSIKMSVFICRCQGYDGISKTSECWWRCEEKLRFLVKSGCRRANFNRQMTCFLQNAFCEKCMVKTILQKISTAGIAYPVCSNQKWIHKYGESIMLCHLRQIINPDQSPTGPSGSAGLFIFKFSTKLMEVKMRIEKKTLNDSFCRKVCSVLDQVPNIVRTRLKLISFAEWLT